MTPEQYSKIFKAQGNLAALINADARPPAIPEADWPPIFNDADDSKKIECITQRKGNIQSSIAHRLQQIGAGVIVMLPLITFVDNEIWRISIGVKFAVVITENPLLNKTGKPGEAMMERIFALVHFKPNGVEPNDTTKASRFIVDRNAGQLMEPTEGGEMLLNYQLNINTIITIRNS